MRITGAGALAASLGVGALFACGVEFALSFLEKREMVLLQAPEATFADEVGLLVPEPADADALKPVEGYEYDYDPVTGEQTRRSPRDEAERDGLTAEQAALVQSLRALDAGEEAFARGEPLPADVRHYTAGAVSFNNEQMDSARAHFAAVLALPPPERTRRELWSRFMLGRLAVRAGDAAEAASQFEAVRTLVRKGAPDKMGLAVASLGEQARVHAGPGGIAEAVKLYVQQAAYGSSSGVTSALRIAGRILEDDGLLDEGIQDELTRRLLFLYLNARVYAQKPYDMLDEPGADEQPGDAAAKGPLERVVDALDRHGIRDRAGIGWLAATAYQARRFDLAQRFAEGDSSALASWIRAKLAWRRGDTAAALGEYERALEAMQRDSQDDHLVAGVMAESAVLRIGRDQFVQALDLLFRANRRVWDVGDDDWTRGKADADYWRDVAYIAERILTADELTRYVDQQVETPTAEEMETALEQGRTLPAASIRWLLGRRLMREGRYAEAMRYFDDEHVRSVASEYVDALARTGRWWRSRVSRAEDWYAAATIARFDGMEVLGYELSPDYSVFGGQFTLDPEGEEGEPGEREPDAPPPDAPPPDAPQEPPSIVKASNAEQQRVESSKPERNVRFHYRVVAVEHAMKAADNLPRSSQAFAAVLCKASGWVVNRQPDIAEEVYARYVREGPYAVWARSFGRQCPQPDFEAARRRVWAVRVESAVRLSRTHPVWSGVMAFGVAAACALSVWTTVRRRRLRASGGRAASVQPPPQSTGS